MRLTWEEGLNFDIYIMDLIESKQPSNASELIDFSEELHQRVEMAIQDYIYDDEKLDINDYEAPY